MIYLAEGKTVRDGKMRIRRLDKLISCARWVGMVYLH
jgi:hypothetical protein